LQQGDIKDPGVPQYCTTLKKTRVDVTYCSFGQSQILTYRTTVQNRSAAWVPTLGLDTCVDALVWVKFTMYRGDSIETGASSQVPSLGT